MGSRFFLLGCADLRQRAGGHGSAADAELVKAAERRELSGRGALGVVLSVQVIQKLAHRDRFAAGQLLVDALCIRLGGRGAGVRLTNLPAEELCELDQVRTVAFDGVVAEVLFKLQIVQKLPNQRRKVFFHRLFTQSAVVDRGADKGSNVG